MSEGNVLFSPPTGPRGFLGYPLVVYTRRYTRLCGVYYIAASVYAYYIDAPNFVRACTLADVMYHVDSLYALHGKRALLVSAHHQTTLSVVRLRYLSHYFLFYALILRLSRGTWRCLNRKLSLARSTINVRIEVIVARTKRSSISFISYL